MQKLYWPVAGLVVGLGSVVGAWFNMGILVGSGDLSVLGSLVVAAEYVIVLALLGWFYDRFIYRR